MPPVVPEELSRKARAWPAIDRDDRRALARSLRLLGLSYSEIAAIIPLAKGTMSSWFQGIELTKEQQRGISERSRPAPGTPRDTQRKRRRQVEQIRLSARRRAVELQDNGLWVAGVTMYWAEGSKTGRRLQLANSDPGALRLFMRWVEAFLDPNPAYRAAIWLHADNDEPAARRYWCRQLELIPTDFTKSYVKPDGTGHRRNHLAAGVCRVTVRRSTDIWVTTDEWSRYLSDTMGVLPSRPGR